MISDDLRSEVHSFIQKNYLFDETKTVGEEQSLLGSGIVDSTGILELISFLEETCHVKFQDNELVSDNFDSVGRIISFMSQKLSQGRSE
jgi:acyl carrier protein